MIFRKHLLRTYTANMNRASGINNLAAGTIECGALLSTSLCFVEAMHIWNGTKDAQCHL
jgi:hypothetical protein